MSCKRASSSFLGFAKQQSTSRLCSAAPSCFSRNAHPSSLRLLSIHAASSKHACPSRPLASSDALPSSLRSLHTTSSCSSQPDHDRHSTATSASAPPAEASLAPLGLKLSSQDILAHFQQPPFPASNLLGSDAELAKRAMTHESFMYGKDGHNRRLAFLGRRSLKMYTILFLATLLESPSLSASAQSYVLRLLETPDALDNVLHTSRLGDAVGRTLQLERVMRWTPAVTDGQRGPLETGLFKIRGVAIEALFGAVYHQAGAQRAANFFHATVLPTLLQDTFPKEVPQEVVQAVNSRQIDASKAL